MFDDLIRELNRLGRSPLTVTVPLLADPEGYLDRECPNTECLFEFKVLEEDWAGKVRDEEVFCPRCGTAAAADKWHTQAQVERAKQAAISEVKHRVHGAMRRDADQWNRRQQGGILKITMRVDGKPRAVLLPQAIADLMQLKVTCSGCSCRFAVVGSAFFCPACGASAADHLFRQSLGNMRRILDALPEVRRALPDRDTAENTARHIVENALEDAVTAFQRYAETLYEGLPGTTKPRRNAFQNLSEGATLWRASTGRGYDAHLCADELDTLSRFFQQRHLLAHREGIVDGDYVARSRDPNYAPGQRIVVREAHVEALLALIEKLGDGLAQDVAAAQAATAGAP